MNRRQLFKSAIGVVGLAMVPSILKAAPCAWHSEGCIGDACEGKPHVMSHNLIAPGHPNMMTFEQYERINSMYGFRSVIGSVHDDYWVGYDNTCTVKDGEKIVHQFLTPVEYRQDHMFLARQTFHGRSWEEAVTYAETYKHFVRMTEKIRGK